VRSRLVLLVLTPLLVLLVLFSSVGWPLRTRDDRAWETERVAGDWTPWSPPRPPCGPSPVTSKPPWWSGGPRSKGRRSTG